MVGFGRVIIGLFYVWSLLALLNTHLNPQELAENHVGGKVGPTVLTVPLVLTPEQRVLVAAAGQVRVGFVKLYFKCES